MDVITIIWLVAGIVMMFMELAIPGMVIIWLGLGAILVSILRWIGVVDAIAPSFMIWFVSSFSFLIFLRRFFKKYFPGEVTNLYSADEDRDAFGTIVDVIETISSNHDQGRIKLGGSTWSASCLEGEIRAGQKARISARDSLLWIVEPVKELLLDEELKKLND